MSIKDYATKTKLLTDFGFKYSYAYAEYFIFSRTKKNVETFLKQYNFGYNVRKVKDGRYLFITEWATK